ncbi:MAG TPA: sialate O-acetylesterase [Tepidisphaeraceae bacterium]|nr:sialate O-acetylesterase [Tepidisphaeraceae bacterium]
MRCSFSFFVLCFIAGHAVAATDAAKLPLLSPMFGDHMVLQRGKPNTFWGCAKPGERVKVSVADRSGEAVAGDDGRWQAKLDPPEGPGPYDVTIEGSPQALRLHDVLVGDVWLCGGQSNMELGLPRVTNAADELKAADHPQVRLYVVHQHVSYATAAVPAGEWKVCTPASVAEGAGFSAVGYFFGAMLNQRLNVPIGLVEDCVGGTTAETWMNPDTLAKHPEFSEQIAETRRLRDAGALEYGNYIMHWYDQYDAGGKNNAWAEPSLDDAGWTTVDVPGHPFAGVGLPDTPAVVWFRKGITLPDPLPAGPAHLHLGQIERMDTAYVNGQFVGASAWVENPRNYIVAAKLLKPGKNLIALRVLKIKPTGGFLDGPAALRLELGDKQSIALAGAWKARVSVDARPPHPMPLGFENWPSMPAVLFNGMIKPVAPLALSGAIWYQGESNAGRAAQYRTLLPELIGDWRREFAQGDFPFYIVSLPAFMHRRYQPGDDGWAELREAQAMAARTVANAGLAVTIDTGEADDIHPKQKRLVGERLALLALAQHYGQPVICAGPMFTSMEHIPSDGSGPAKLRLHFDHTDGGLVSKGGMPAEFSVAGADHTWHWADAKIDGDTVIVQSPEVADPQQVRYAWQSNPVATLYNGAGLPAVPFRTDAPGAPSGDAK